MTIGLSKEERKIRELEGRVESLEHQRKVLLDLCEKLNGQINRHTSILNSMLDLDELNEKRFKAINDGIKILSGLPLTTPTPYPGSTADVPATPPMTTSGLAKRTL